MKRKAVSGIMLTLLFAGVLTLALRIQQAWVWASVPPDYAWIHGYVYKNSTHDLPLRGILLELWDNSSTTFVMDTTSADSDVGPGAFDFGNVYTGANRTFFVRIVTEGYNATGYNMLDVVNETTGTLVFYDSSAFICFSEQEYVCTLRGPDVGDPTTVADSAISVYYYVWLVYDYFRKNLDHYTYHVTAHLVSGLHGGYGSAFDIWFGATVGEIHRHVFGHEYGHSIMFQMYYPTTYCNSTQGHTGPHYDRSAWNMCHNVLADPDFGNAAYPVPCSCDALIEGWANFVPWLAYGAYNYTYGPEAFGWWLDMREGAGEKNEYGFTGILHDICNIPGQNQNIMMRYIWEVLSKDQTGSVVQFYDAFVTRYPALTDDVKIAYMKRFAVFSRLGIEVNATENASGIHVNVSGYLMPFPHPNKTVTVNYRLVGVPSWTWFANVTTDNSSFYSVAADLPEGLYEFHSSWSGDRGHHTGHHDSTSDVVRTDEHYIGSINGVKLYTDKSVYHLGNTVQIKIINTNHTQETVSAYSPYGECPWPTFYNYSYADFYLQIFYPNSTLALNRSVLVPPFYGTAYVGFTNTTVEGHYNVKIFNEFVGSIYVKTIPAVGGIYIQVDKLEVLAPYLGLTILLAVAAATVVYAKKRKKIEISS